VVGSIVVRPEGVDFTRLEPTWLAVGLFVAVPAACAAGVGVVFERLARSDITLTRVRLVGAVALAVAFPMSLLALALCAAALTYCAVFRHAFEGRLARRPGVRLVVQASWLCVGVLGLAALLRDIGRLR
jgi:hypothetical protein